VSIVTKQSIVSISHCQYAIQFLVSHRQIEFDVAFLINLLYGCRYSDQWRREGAGAYATGRRPRGAPSGSRKFFFECSISSVNCYEFRGRHFHSHWQSIAIFFMVLIVAEPRIAPLYAQKQTGQQRLLTYSAATCKFAFAARQISCDLYCYCWDSPSATAGGISCILQGSRATALFRNNVLAVA
jgi:hypothetical protein